jgi:hypothetical protein
MLVLELEQIEIDYCPSCRGIWLDSGELEMLLEGGPQSEKSHAFLSDLSVTEKQIRCPKCRKKMAKVRPQNNPDVVLDSCMAGHGIWFDKGELFELLKNEKSAFDNRILDVLRGIFRQKPKEK